MAHMAYLAFVVMASQYHAEKTGSLRSTGFFFGVLRKNVSQGLGFRVSGFRVRAAILYQKYPFM